MEANKKPFMKVFMSYHFPYEQFVARVNYYLSKQPSLEPYCYANEKRSGYWQNQIGNIITDCEKFVLFVGEELGNTQEDEVRAFQNLHQKGIRMNAVLVKLPDACDLPQGLWQMIGLDPVVVSRTYQEEPEAAETVDERAAWECAKSITILLIGPNWIPDDGLPIGYPFDYEKNIIKEYVQGNGRLRSVDKLERGCPERWPKVEKEQNNIFYPNPLSEQVVGSYRSEDAEIIVDVRSKYHCWSEDTNTCCLVRNSLTFPEAGPRKDLLYPLGGAQLTAGILVSGGIAPGINSVIAGIVKRHYLYQEQEQQNKYALQIFGYRDGFAGLLRGTIVTLTQEQAKKYANLGGSMIGTSRCNYLLDMKDPKKRKRSLFQVINQLVASQVDILYVIGGDGSMRAAHAIWTLAQEMYKNQEIPRKISVVAIPKTMDNDILWVWQSFGFLSAVEKAKQFVLQLHTEAKSNPRLCIMQLFGSDSGFIVSHTAVASGVCDAALIPEVDFSMEALWKHIRTRLKAGLVPGSSPYGTILVAETAIPQDVEEYIDDHDVALEVLEKAAILKFLNDGRRVEGKTPEKLRRSGLKIISRVLQKKIREMPQDFWKEFRVFTNEPRHLIRAIDPSVQDVIFGQRLGVLAVDSAMAGYTNFMISQWLTEYVLVPLKLVVLGRKRVPQNGIFWKSLLANTEQPEKMV